MKVRIVCYENIDSWILGKFATKLDEELKLLNITSSIAKVPDATADINHHIIYYDYNGKMNSLDTVMITHIDKLWKLKIVKQQLVSASMGICMSADTVMKLANAGVPREKLCYINPAHDGLMKPRPLIIGIANRIYNDGRKREYMLVELCNAIKPREFTFRIMGDGWQDIVEFIKNKGFSVEYYERFDYDIYQELVPTLDYFLYLGLDEGAMSFVDALSAGVPTIVTPQGYHLDAIGGITHPFETIDELIAVFNKIAERKRRLIKSVEAWTWKNYVYKHAEIWGFLLGLTKEQQITHTQGKYKDGIFSMIR